MQASRKKSKHRKNDRKIRTETIGKDPRDENGLTIGNLEHGIANL